MESYPREIEIYVAANGRAPFSDWLASLRDAKAKAKIKIRLDHIRLGNLGDFKFIGEGVYELRMDYGPGYRIYFGQKGKIIVVLLMGGDKSTQNKDIKKAQEYWADYRS